MMTPANLLELADHHEKQAVYYLGTSKAHTEDDEHDAAAGQLALAALHSCWAEQLRHHAHDLQTCETCARTGNASPLQFP